MRNPPVLSITTCPVFPPLVCYGCPPISRPVSPAGAWSHACYLLKGVVPESHTHTSLTSPVFSWIPRVWPTQLLPWALKAHAASSSNLLVALPSQQTVTLLPFNPPKSSALSIQNHLFHQSVTPSCSPPYNLSQGH